MFNFEVCLGKDVFWSCCNRTSKQKQDAVRQKMQLGQTLTKRTNANMKLQDETVTPPQTAGSLLYFSS